MSTTLSEAREAIYNQFIDGWGSLTPITRDNLDFNPSGLDEWVRLSVRHTASAQETLNSPGLRRFARFGSVFVQIYTEGNKGTSRTDDLAEAARNLFEGLSLSGTTVRFLDVVFRETGAEEEWFQSIVEATFEYDETK